MTLKKADGQSVTLPLAQLSRADQNYVRMLSVRSNRLDANAGQPTSGDPVHVMAETPLKVGDKLLAEWGRRWRDVEVLALTPNGDVKIRWVGYGSAWDEVVPRSRLRLSTAAPP